MNNIPEWDEALEEFRTFLSSQGHPSKVYWVFREDVFLKSQTSTLVRWPLPEGNKSLAESVFEGGRTMGLVSLCAIGRLRDSIVAAVWYPKFPEEEVQGWNRGMKLEINIPLATATKVPQFIWNFLEITSRYRMSQKVAAPFIGTKKWAAA